MENSIETSEAIFQKRRQRTIAPFNEVVEPTHRKIYGVPRENIIQEEIFGSGFSEQSAFPLDYFVKSMKRLKTVFCHSSEVEDDISKHMSSFSLNGLEI